QMTKLLVVVLGAAITLGCAYFYLKGQAGQVSADGKSAPKQTLDNVRTKAKSIEDDAQKRADELMEKTTP
ncbi:MAG: hypothetical protein ACYC8T_26075, partial [Myxococcaceae bacterium]